MDRVRKLKTVLWALLGLALAVAAARFLYGLGVNTNLTDTNAWGVWIGFDVMSGVALAAGGFVVTATVYIFHLERFHGVVRAAVLTAFLGYVAVAISLLFDLGLPWNIWHMTVYWNPHSPLFEVGWCVMLYLAVLALEFFPIPAEEFPRLSRVRASLTKLRIPLVLLGIGLSTMHQSSLGSLFLIMPARLHPLWYSPILPILFLVSAIGLGLLMVIVESHTTAFLYRRKPETEMLASFAVAARWVMAGYVALRLIDLLARGQAPRLFAISRYTALFWFELALMAIVPAVLFGIPRVRSSRRAQASVAFAGVCGTVLNRIDVGGFAHLHGDGKFYFPAWTEIATSIGILAATVLLFLFIVERFKIWERRPADPDAGQAPRLNPVGNTWLGTPAIAARTLYSLAFVLAAGIGFALLVPQPLKAERGVEAVPAHMPRGGDVLWIDGNLDGFGVNFKHADHVKREGDKNSCVKCHHMNLPRAQNTSCARCHRDMYQPSDAFRHDWHASAAGGRVGCFECHANGRVRNAATAVKCDHCHKNLVPAGALVQVKRYQAVSYSDAMHRTCIRCHRLKAVEKNKPEMTRCAWCHREMRGIVDNPKVVLDPRAPIGRGVVLPDVPN